MTYTITRVRQKLNLLGYRYSSRYNNFAHEVTGSGDRFTLLHSASQATQDDPADYTSVIEPESVPTETRVKQLTSCIIVKRQVIYLYIVCIYSLACQWYPSLTTGYKNRQ